jgi:glycosyltransferase involved in cell wall biosynthesis
VALSESRREELGQEARARIEKLFALSGVVKQYEKLYLEVTNEQRKN